MFKKDDHTSQCLGHDFGCILFPSYHRDSTRQHRFWIYSQTHGLVDSRWDFHAIPDDNVVSIKKHPNDVLDYRCMLQILSYFPR
jgi:hypothetical protein